MNCNLPASTGPSLDSLVAHRQFFSGYDGFKCRRSIERSFSIAAIRTADEAIAALRRAGPEAAAALAEVESHRALRAEGTVRDDSGGGAVAFGDRPA
jgi:hypothetical protein